MDLECVFGILQFVDNAGKVLRIVGAVFVVAFVDCDFNIL